MIDLFTFSKIQPERVFFLKILSLLNDINTNKNFRKKTLSGCILEKVNKSIIISKEN